MMLRALPSSVEKEVVAKVMSSQARNCLHILLHVEKVLLAF